LVSAAASTGLASGSTAAAAGDEYVSDLRLKCGDEDRHTSWGLSFCSNGLLNLHLGLDLSGSWSGLLSLGWLIWLGSLSGSWLSGIRCDVLAINNKDAWCGCGFLQNNGYG
jgi:hypothetical protein